MADWIYAVILGVIEGVTEFIPVSSTGMLLLSKTALGLPDGFWDTFCVLIQLGAILAVLALYFSKLWGAVVRLPSDPGARRFALSVLIAFLPAAVLGVLLHDFIKHVLFDSPLVQCVSLIVGGVVLLFVDRLAMIPGVSRSGATIVGSMLMGVEKRAAAEFSFFLAIPTMAGAFAVDAFKNRHELMAVKAEIPLIAIGFVVSFVVAMLVIRAMLAILAKRGLAPFGWFRILVGGIGLAVILLG